jgi:magnesium transporter
MIRVALLSTQTDQVRTGGESLVDEWRAAASARIWVDLTGEPLNTERQFLKRYFALHELALDDAQSRRHPPKLEWFSDHFFLLLKAFHEDTDSVHFALEHISFFVGETFLITRRSDVSNSVDRVWDDLREGQLGDTAGPYMLCYRIIRSIIDRYTPVVLDMETRLDELEEAMLERPSDVILAELTGFNSRLKKLRRIFGLQQGPLAELAERADDASGFTEKVKHEFQDVREQMVRLASLTELLQGLARDLMDSYISVSSHRLNQIMKVLTIVAAIFLPLTFMAGIYGMNFDNMPELHSEWGYYILLSAMGALAVAMIAVFRKLRWL